MRSDASPPSQTLIATPLAPLAATAKVSCLCVTQPGREKMLERAMSDFVRQHYAHRELVIMHDADDAWHADCEALAASFRDAQDCDIRVFRASAGLSLGELRNLSVAQARGELVCQWDDDDRSHPDRLAIQIKKLNEENAIACFLTQQLHWFADTRELIAEDCTRDLYPGNVVQGSALVRRAAMPAYDVLRRGEDTALLQSLVRAGARIAHVRGQPWLYCYHFHGGNTFNRAHHAAIANAKRLTPAAELNIAARVRDALREFDPAIDGSTESP
jgi:glycosyltransferase involved in cell wall biosynthesis